MSLSNVHSEFLFLGLTPLVFMTIATALVQAWHRVVSRPEYLPNKWVFIYNYVVM